MNILTNILLVSILLANLALLGFFVLVTIKIFNIARGFVMPESEGKPSPLAMMVSSAGDILARSIVALFKTTFMGKESGAARAEKAVEGDIAEGIISQANPGIASILGSFPSLKKTLRRNPALIDFALSKLTKIGNPGGPQLGGGNGSSQVKFNL